MSRDGIRTPPQPQSLLGVVDPCCVPICSPLPLDRGLGLGTDYISNFTPCRALTDAHSFREWVRAKLSWQSPIYAKVTSGSSTHVTEKRELPSIPSCHLPDTSPPAGTGHQYYNGNCSILPTQRIVRNTIDSNTADRFDSLRCALLDAWRLCVIIILVAPVMASSV